MRQGTTRTGSRGASCLVWWVVAALAMVTGCAKGQPVAGQAATLGMQPGDTGDTDGDDGDDGDDEDTGEEGGICLAHNCDEDLHCAGCDEGRTSCYVAERRCVACDPESGEGCPDGQDCTEFGYCVPGGQTCETDADGVPTISCDADADCAACDPRHQLCDTATNRCIACTSSDQEHCLAVEHCSDGECVADCPESCTTAADCSQCGEAGHEARACHRHRCAECSDDAPCSGSQVCNDQGVCVDFCGIPGQVPGTCDDDGDCAGCPGDSTNCNAPINGGHGSCGPEAAGCSDLGNGVVVLPEPYDEVTNLCSSDVDCNGIGINYNVGELLRDLTGIDSIDDANVFYPMAACANLTVGIGDNSISCGVCVPCKTDNDCQDINIDEVAGEAFGPLGFIASALLLDQLFGAQSHEIHMFCQQVGAGYGACLPCPTLTSDCTGGGSSTGSGSCSHDVCATGGPLDPSCGSCAANVCAADGFCCNDAWDSICVGLVETQCAGSCSGGSGGNCSHDQCTTGAALDPTCNTCTSSICAADPYCCQTEWDGVCVDLVQTHCGGSCGGSGCVHSECQQGGPLTSTCSSCAGSVCALDNYCCSVDWDAQCVSEAQDLCGGDCGGGGGGAACGHDECLQGAPLQDNCSPCVGAICDIDPFCCDVTWDQTCVNRVDQLCTPGC